MPGSSPILSIQWGTYAGECIGYCRESMSITPGRVVYTLQSNLPGDELPDKVLETGTSSDLWNRLAQAIDVNAVFALPKQMGQPDAADQGGEYIEIDVGGASKRVDLERGGKAAELDRLLAILHPLQSELAAQMGK